MMIFVSHCLIIGVAYIKENVDKLMEGNEEHMTCGFEVVFPALLQKAKGMGIEDLPYDAPAVHEVYHTREQKLKRLSVNLIILLEINRFQFKLRCHN